MSAFLIYSLQAIILQALFVIVFEIFFEKETFFKANRIYLIGSLILSFIIPLIEIPINLIDQEQAIIQLKEIVITRNNSVFNIDEKASAYSFIFIIYLIGFLIFFGLFFYKLIKIFSLIKSSKHFKNNQSNLFYIENSNQAFSFFNFIFIGTDNQNFDVIVKHELVHAKQWHSLDILIVEILKIVFWFNPILYHYHKRFIELHEFEADMKSANEDKKKYFEVLLCQILNCNSISLTNNFYNQSLIKKRIVMLQKSKSKRRGIAKYLVVIPVVVLSMTVFSTTIVAQEVKKIEKVVGNKPNETTETAPNQTTKTPSTMVKMEPKVNTEVKVEEISDDIPFVVMDQIPLFPDCVGVEKSAQFDCFHTQMQQHIKQNFTYPVEAMKKNIQGRIMIEYLINKNGDVEILRVRGPVNSELLQEEAKRIISLLPKFIPGKQKGKIIGVKHVIPITFKIQ
ncbi:TonB family protein [Flavobacterium sp. HXWNR29]|uniref:TonB family protein n=1 Tax=Flavobacterium odoriferum TaxID=2946604 RepID=UPI0021CB44CA|nr:TonB family protein [Flavobacterium sp. HXWNR29]MCU4187643.1 TonB family protein [Flavobacterium sp. HXWNR29]